MKESVARKQRIEVLEKKRRQIRNQKQYVRRQQFLPTALTNAMTTVNEEYDDGDDNNRDAVAEPPQSTHKWRNIALVSAGLVAAGMLVFNSTK